MTSNESPAAPRVTASVPALEGQTNLGGTVAEISVREIARSIAARLRSNPGSWMKLSYAHNSEGEPTSPLDIDFQRGCLIGHAMRLAGGMHEPVVEQFRESCAAVLELESPALWNDTPGRKVEEIIDLCDRVAAGEQQ